ncbi:helix-turn-helix domain-containing protein [Paenibacillus sp. FSL R7-0210]|uniref:helix-turn-helix domain-containing protein n=1 Tax=Paenibacillus sp. FSL R7-0210 TaxID=2921676 RepID=UPI004046DD58
MGYKPGRCLLTRRLNEIGKTQQWLIEVTGINKSQISDYATSRRYMSLGSAMTIAKAIGCHIEDLYDFIRE